MLVCRSCRGGGGRNLIAPAWAVRSSPHDGVDTGEGSRVCYPRGDPALAPGCRGRSRVDPSCITKVMPPATLGVLAVAAGALASCASMSGAARDTFSRSVSCPPEQVTVVRRPGYPRSLPPEPSPPLDVAADPNRLAFWHKERAAEQEAARNQGQALGCTSVWGWSPGDVFEVEGCGQRTIYCCFHPDQTYVSQGSVVTGSDSSRATCGVDMRSGPSLQPPPAPPTAPAPR